jgi:dimethylamine/trimethylamine dehydrogenase
MTQTPRPYTSFEHGFAVAFEEELSGETYFAALSEAQPDPRRAAIWAKFALIELHTHTALRPLADRLGLAPADPDAVLQSGRDEAVTWAALDWHDIMALMVRDYPAYVTEFEAVKAMAPPEMQAALQLLIDHEVAFIDFAHAELAGDPASAAPLDAYLAHVATWTP